MSVLETAPPVPAPPSGRLRLSWLQPAGLLAVSAANFALKLLTLGVYNFWGKTEVRRKIWSAVRIEGEPLHYTGTGAELFHGFVVIFAAVLLPLMLTSYAVVLFFGPQSAVLGIYQAAVYTLFFFLTGIGMWRAQRYRLSRTSWRGIRGGLAGNDRHFAWTYFWTGLLIPPTLGWILPWRATKLQGLLMNAASFGDKPFRFEASSRPLYGRFALLWAGTLVIAAASILTFGSLLPPELLGGLAAGMPLDAAAILTLVVAFYSILAVAMLAYMLLSAVYRARMMNHFAAHTRLETARFRSTATGSGLVGLAFGNFLLWLLGWGAGLMLMLFAISFAQPFLAADPQSFMGHSIIWLGALLLISSAGLLAPLVQARNARYMIQNLAIEGSLPLDQVAQGTSPSPRRGEGLAQMLELDAF